MQKPVTCLDETGDVHSPVAHVRACLHSALESSSQVIMLLYKMCIKLYTSQNWKRWATDLTQTITLK